MPVHLLSVIVNSAKKRNKQSDFLSVSFRFIGLKQGIIIFYEPFEIIKMPLKIGFVVSRTLHPFAIANCEITYGAVLGKKFPAAIFNIIVCRCILKKIGSERAQRHRQPRDINHA